MTWLAVWLLGVGVTDLARPLVVRLPLLAPALGALTVVGIGVLAGLTGAADLAALTGSVVPLVLWWHASERAQGHRGHHHVVALTALVGGAFTLVATSGWSGHPAGPLGRWLGWAHLPFHGDLGRLLIVLALVAVNLATANIVVRLVLVSVGAIRPGAAAGTQPADRLKGGRLLGPMERLVILGLGLAGQLTAAGLVIAAKGLLRFPELQSRAQGGSAVDPVGIDEMTEYFLVGSFVSWLIALASLALAH